MQETRIALVLGLQLSPEGTVSSDFRKRVERGMSLIRAGQVDLVVISGGVSLNRYPSEAAAALMLVPEHLQRCFLLEEKSLSTRQNIINTKHLLRAKEINARSISVICSNGQWRWRTKQMFAKLWPEVKPSPEIVGTETTKDTAVHMLLYVMTVVDPKEKVFLPLKRWLLKHSS